MSDRGAPEAGRLLPSSTVGIAIEEAAGREGFRLAGSQVKAAERLAALGAALVDGEPRLDCRGVYLWGPVGRGKTWLLDRFYESVAVPEKVRFHFQRFFREFNAALAGRPIGRPAVAAALDETIGAARLICFDELYAHETGDAALLTRLLEEVTAARRVPLVVTSNYPPHGLLPDAELRTSDGPVIVRHARFLRGIELLENVLEVVQVDDGIDHRQTPARSDGGLQGFRSGRFLVPGSADQVARLLGIEEVPTTRETLGVGGGRRLHPRAVVDRAIWFDFAAICEGPVSAGDILGLTSRYTTWVITGIPRLRDATPEVAQRFVNLVDVLHDADTRAIFGAAHTLDVLVGGEEGLPPDIARARSRLSMLVSPPS